MSRWHYDRHVEREEERLEADLAAGRITQAEYNDEIRQVMRDVRDAEEQDYQDALDDLNSEWGRY